MEINKKFLVICLYFISIHVLTSQDEVSAINVSVSFDENLQSEIKSEGRLLLFLSDQENAEPRTRTWPRAGNFIFAKNFADISAESKIDFSNSSDIIRTGEWGLDALPAGTYYVQALWDHDQFESRINAPGNIYSKVKKIDVPDTKSLSISLSELIGPRSILNNTYAEEVTINSPLLSDFWKRDMNLKASVLLPKSYFDEPDRTYPVRYNVAGYGGRYTRINRLVSNFRFMSWWLSDEAPQVITVFLDGEGPYGDSYQMDSDNSGPYGQSLIEEVIPHIESNFRVMPSAKYRFVDGCSTGGWVSLALQLYYPDEFNGVWSYSPDAVEFENYQLINIYKDQNAFVNEHGIKRPVSRSTDGEPTMLLRHFIQYENVLGRSNSYTTSGGQFSAHNALYSPKGADGLPRPIFDPETGIIDQEVAEHWKKYDMKIHARENWKELGPKVKGKIYIWMGDMDNFYLNPATRALDELFDEMTDPPSDAQIEFTPMARHCQNFSNRRVLEQIAEKLIQMED